MSKLLLSPVDNSVEDVSVQDRARIGMTFESENAAYEFYNQYGRKITNIFWANPRMLIDYALFGDVVIFNTTFCTNKEYKPFGIFEDSTIIRKKPKTIFTDQDAAMARAIGEVLPETRHGLCTWHTMQNGIKHLDDYQLENNSWLTQIYSIKHKWARCYMKYTITLGVKSTQLIESINSDLKIYLRPTLNLVRFFKQFEWIVEDKRANELKADFEARNTLPRTMGCNAPMLRQAGRVYTAYIFNEFRKEHDIFLACSVKDHILEWLMRKLVNQAANIDVDFEMANINADILGKEFATLTVACPTTKDSVQCSEAYRDLVLKRKEGRKGGGKRHKVFIETKGKQKKLNKTVRSQTSVSMETLEEPSQSLATSDVRGVSQYTKNWPFRSLLLHGDRFQKAWTMKNSVMKNSLF
ncbi:protein FAR1-RELATED SEQUENCE 5-like [Telopea speciosissima]|uniref:protein FAR1-RELATED SEQUENCE 5-like n=1 Tax=Telopea speciosissima TaxID=54955 RepID=UPI001CC79AFA|nr:protein FAR1-RELATED SEQUENCE 5-like [Telopea speciosissima]